MRALPRVAQRVLGAPLAIAPAKLEAVLSVLGPRIGLPGAGPAAAWEDDEDRGAHSSSKPYRVVDGVAVIPVHGITVQRGGWLNAMSGLIGYDDIVSLVSAAYVDPAVQGMVLDIDSPGGEVAGLELAASYVADVAAEKPMVALANEGAYSAGYWLASAARRVMLPRTGGVGSIGVVATHVDRSREDQERGHAYTFIHAGARKIDGNAHAPLTDPAREAIQAEVDRLAAIFHAHVAAMRGLSREAVAAQEARTFHGEAAIAAGLADRIGGLADAIAWARSLATSNTPFSPRAESPTRVTGSNGGPMTAANKPEAEAPGAVPPADAAVTALAAERARVREIGEICTIAGVPEKALAFITEGKTVEAVRTSLLAERASADEARDIQAAKGGEAPKPGARRLPDPYAIYQRRAAQAAGRKEA